MEMSKAKINLGIFLVSGFALLLVALYLFGMGDFFKRQAQFVTVFSESVQGLSVGSPVKYKGVPIGSVSSITIQTQNKLIRVEMKINEKSFVQSGDDDVEKTFFDFFDHELKNGLRARLEMNGITGLRYVELNTFDVNEDSPLLPRPEVLEQGELYIPSSPSLFTDVMNTLSLAVKRFSQVEFDRISTDMVGALTAVRATFEGESFQKAVANSRATSENLNQITGKINRQIDDINLGTMSSDFSSVMESIQKFSSNADDTLFKLNRSIDAMTVLMEFLLRDPSALIRGRSLPQVRLPQGQK